MATFGGGGFGAEARQESVREPLLNGELRKEVSEVNGGVAGFGTAGILSLATVSWLNPLLALGYRKHLEIEDVPELLPEDRGREVYRAFNCVSKRLRDEHPERAPSISLVLVRTFWISVLCTGVLLALNTVASYVGPYLISDFVEFLGGRRRFPMEGYVLVACFFLAGVISSLAERHYYLGIYRLSVHVRACLTATLYEKSMRLSSVSRNHRTSGEIINYMAVDVERVIDFLWWIHDIWDLPLQVCLALAILYTNVGLAAAVAALIATIATVLFNVPLAALQRRFQEQLMGAKDARMKTTSECLRNMRILKLQAWETEFLSQIEKLRATEYKYLARDLYMVAASTFLTWTSPVIVAITTFGTCILLGVPLTPGRVLSTIATLQILRNPLQNLSDFVSMQAQAKVSFYRLLLFSQEPELPTDSVVRCSEFELHGNAIEIENGVFSWSTDDDEKTLPPSTLRDVNLRVQKGAHVAVCGSVGSGKSALLACMLGEIPKLEGTVRVEGQTAYVAQTPWIQGGTFKENICFGRHMDEELYERVLQACDLKKDIAMFPFGDDTGIGERGINLSGGQKQRVQLARALYQEADVYFLDDPFSAVDAHTGSHLLKECIMGFLASKTVVYVTHQMEFLHSADHILVLRDGVVIQAGKYNDLLEAGTEFSTLSSAHNKALEDMHMHASMSNGDLDRQQSNHSMHNASDGGDTTPKDNQETVMTSENSPLQQLVKEEEMERGDVSFKVYWAYATAIAGGAFVPVYLVALIGFQVFQIWSSYWMAWGTSPSDSGSMQVSTKTLILVYILLAFLGIACLLVRALTVSILGLKTAQKYYLKMLRSIFRASMSFFDSTPSGRILTRMSGDQTTMDLEIQFSMSRVANTFMQLLGIFALMSTVTWQVLLLIIPIALACILLQRYYISSARELARLTSVQKSPILNHYGESISGAITIRGFHQEERFMATNLNHLDTFARAYFYKTASREWLIMRMELMSVLVFTVCLLFMVAIPQASINPSLAGVAIMNGSRLSNAFARLIWNVTALETTVISVERILQYCTLPSEPSLVIENARPSQNWPSQGTIAIHNLQVRYNAHSPLVLHGLSCTFNGGEKVGIVGRTGSGKSTLIQALFRMVEPVGGSIEIDKLDISTIGLHDLRSSLSIIPQDPTLFQGSMRINLDPLGKYSDAEIWEALDKCQLGDIVRAKEQKLESSVSENGENWSVGQRQLVCLGRALLKQTRILVLDEATASVDSATDELIQETLRSEFSACTVITVAHRIPTIVDSDKVLVLDRGRVVEHNSPTALLQDQSSFFSKLVMEYSI